MAKTKTKGEPKTSAAKAEKIAKAAKLPALTIEEPAPVQEEAKESKPKKEKKSKKEKKQSETPAAAEIVETVLALNPPDAETKEEATEDGGQQYRIYLRPQQIEWLQKRYGANLPPTRLITLLLVETEASHKAQDLAGFAKFLKKSESKLGGALAKLLNEYINK